MEKFFDNRDITSRLYLVPCILLLFNEVVAADWIRQASTVILQLTSELCATGKFTSTSAGSD